jgi:hypothetical protein
MRHHEVRLAHFAGIIGSGLSIIPPCKLGRLGESPGQILVPVLLVPLALGLLIAGPSAGNLSTVGSIIAHLRKTADRPRLQHDGQSQDLAHPRKGEQIPVGLFQFHSVDDGPLDLMNLTGQMIDGFFAGLSNASSRSPETALHSYG